MLAENAAAITEQKTELEEASSGAVPEFSTSAVQLVNAVKDLVGLIAAPSTIQVMTNTRVSLIEVCFRNGLDVSELDRVYQLNTQLDDLLDIPPYTVINL
ncbi:MAG: hypothetical protein EOP06_27275 [Proteobacteria bacterium]|nr:MAG: hypothetical protein EOP06_27275 [Pseudomonadota bacterium]